MRIPPPNRARPPRGARRGRTRAWIVPGSRGPGRPGSSVLASRARPPVRATALAGLLTLGALTAAPSPARSQSGGGPAAGAGAPDGGAAMFRGGPAHTGVYATRGLDGYGGLLWRAATDGPVRSTAVVGGGRVHVGSADGRVYALDRADGTVAWSRDLGAPVNGSPALSGDTLYVTDHASVLHALDARTGTPLWTVTTGEELPLPWGHESGDLYASSPTLAGGSVYFGSGDGRLYSVDAATGDVRWTVVTEGRIRSTPAVAGGRAFVGSGDGSVYAVDVASGEVVWRHDTEGASLHSGDFGYDRRTVQSSPAVADGRVFVGARDGHLYGLDAETGERLWRSDHKISWVNSSPAVAEGLVIAGTSDRQFVQAVDAATGEERWRVDSDGIVWTSPAIVGNRVVIAEGAGRIRELDLRTGEERWSTYVGGRLFASPVVDDGALFIASEDGGVYALRSAGGRPLRRAVFWDSAYVRSAWYAGHRELADWLEGRGYERLDAEGLARFLESRTADRAPSAVVFAIDHVPAAVAAGDRASLLRRYLDAGGTVVWVGVPPLLWRRDPETGSPGELADVDWPRPERALGVDHDAAIFDPVGTWPTAAGKALGLPGSWLSRWNVRAAEDLEVLAVDERGLASSWRRAYGGPPGTGLVRVWGSREPIPDAIPVLVAAERRPGP